MFKLSLLFAAVFMSTAASAQPMILIIRNHTPQTWKFWGNHRANGQIRGGHDLLPNGGEAKFEIWGTLPEGEIDYYDKHFGAQMEVNYIYRNGMRAVEVEGVKREWYRLSVTPIKNGNYLDIWPSSAR